MKRKHGLVYDYEYEAVPSEARKRWYIITLIWVAMGIDVSGLFLGTFLSSGLTFHYAIYATLIGSALLSLLAVLCANVGYNSGLSASLISCAIFGRIGGKFIVLITATSTIGWFAFQLDFFVNTLQKSLEYYDITLNRLYVLFFATLLMTSVAIFGVRGLAKLSLFTVPIMLGLLITGVVMAGLQQTNQVIIPIKTPISLGAAISYVMSAWIIASVMVPDVSRYAKSRKDSLLGVGFGFFLGNSATILVALFLTNSVGNSDLVEIFFNIGLGVSAILILLFAQWTTNSHNLVSASLGLPLVISVLSRPVLIVLMALIGLFFAYYGMIENFIPFLSFLTVLVAPVAGTYLAQYYFIDADYLRNRESKKSKAIYPAAIISWLCGCLVVCLTSPGLIGLLRLSTIPTLDGIFVSMLCYILLNKFTALNIP